MELNEYRLNKDNNEYLMLDIKIGAFSLIKDTPENVSNNVMEIYKKILEYEFQNRTTIFENIAVRKDELICNYILNNTEKYIDAEKYISYDRVISAFYIAVIKDDIKMTNKILPLLKDKVEGKVEELGKYPEYVLDYILKNNDFKEYLNPRKTDEYYVFEDNQIVRKNLKQEKNKVYTKEK